jgi:hypothetical protein
MITPYVHFKGGGAGGLARRGGREGGRVWGSTRVGPRETALKILQIVHVLSNHQVQYLSRLLGARSHHNQVRNLKNLHWRTHTSKP